MASERYFVPFLISSGSGSGAATWYFLSAVNPSRAAIRAAGRRSEQIWEVTARPPGQAAKKIGRAANMAIPLIEQFETEPVGFRFLRLRVIRLETHHCRYDQVARRTVLAKQQRCGNSHTQPAPQTAQVIAIGEMPHLVRQYHCQFVFRFDLGEKA